MECVLKVGVIGINHKTADLSFREAIARASVDLSGEKSIFFPHPIVLLSTCNRTEIYFGGDDLASIHSDLLCYLRRHLTMSFEHRLYSYFGLDCFAHLGRVTAGLDSAIVAETEIQRQVKVAYAKAAEFFHLTSCMHYVFQKSLKLGKFLRNQFPVDVRAPTLYQAIWHLGTEKLGDLLQKKILLVGHSDTNRKMAAFLTHRGCKNLTLITQRPEAVTLANCTALSREHLPSWPCYDFIISAASSDSYLIHGHTPRHHAIFDLSVPRTVDPALASYNIEEVNQWIDSRRSLQSDQLALCNALIWRETIRLARSYRQKLLYLQASI